MPTYLYETIPQVPDEAPERFEVKQSMKDEALRVHPESGRPVRRVITGGIAIPRKLASSVAGAGAGDCCPTCH
ncbi:MAG TPA: zinc ribbon domain-containing protein [Bacteroidia bacterium]|nr:zinc ribbon domain-containing protein [Bacteroidia bacterium]